MRTVGMGDMAQGLVLRLRAQALKQALARASSEVATGRRADPLAATAGDATAQAGIARDLVRLGGFRIAALEAGQRAAAMQAALGAVQAATDGLGARLATAQTGSAPGLVDALGADAAQRFAAAVAALNGRAADRTLLAGAATDGPALAPADDILAALEAAVAGETTAAGVAAAVAAWFAAPSGGFADTGYRGGPAGAAVAVAPGEAVALDITAADPAVASALEGLALAALIGRGVLAGDTAGRAALARQAGGQVLAGDTGLVGVRARLGEAEARIEAAAVRNAATATALEVAAADLAAADPYAAASRLAEAEGQLQALYLMTARLARLSLTEYLR